MADIGGPRAKWLGVEELDRPRLGLIEAEAGGGLGGCSQGKDQEDSAEQAQTKCKSTSRQVLLSVRESTGMQGKRRADQVESGSSRASEHECGEFRRLRTADVGIGHLSIV